MKFLLEKYLWTRWRIRPRLTQSLFGGLVWAKGAWIWNRTDKVDSLIGGKREYEKPSALKCDNSGLQIHLWALSGVKPGGYRWKMPVVTLTPSRWVFTHYLMSSRSKMREKIVCRNLCVYENTVICQQLPHPLSLPTIHLPCLARIWSTIPMCWRLAHQLVHPERPLGLESPKTFSTEELIPDFIAWSVRVSWLESEHHHCPRVCLWKACPAFGCFFLPSLCICLPISWAILLLLTFLPHPSPSTTRTYKPVSQSKSFLL